MMFHVHAQFAMLHAEKHPELRIGQLMVNFEQWLKDKKGIDLFYLEDVRFVPLMEEYLEGGAE